jgi:hypothetical protein
VAPSVVRETRRSTRRAHYYRTRKHRPVEHGWYLPALLDVGGQTITIAS